MVKKLFLAAAIVLILISCGKHDNVMILDELYVSRLEQERENKDWELTYGQRSPFNTDTTARQQPLKYFEPAAEFIFKSKLYKNDNPDTVIIFGTRGEERKSVIEGFFILNYKENDYRLNLYKSFSLSGQEYYSILFTDKTTGKETYHVGRYLDITYNPDPDFIYEIDFNRAYNPYCAYSDLYTCPIPTKDDYLDFEIRAGEMNFHAELNMEKK